MGRADRYLVFDGLAQCLFKAIEDHELLHFRQHKWRDGALAKARKLRIFLEVLHDGRCWANSVNFTHCKKAHRQPSMLVGYHLSMIAQPHKSAARIMWTGPSNREFSIALTVAVFGHGAVHSHSERVLIARPVLEFLALYHRVLDCFCGQNSSTRASQDRGRTDCRRQWAAKPKSRTC